MRFTSPPLESDCELICNSALLLVLCTLAVVQGLASGYNALRRTAPSVDTSNLRLHTGGAMSIALTSAFASPMDLRPGHSSAKVVANGASCSTGSAGGTVENSDLGPSDIPSSTSATANFVFTTAGVYDMCFRFDSAGTYAKIANSIRVQSVLAPAQWSPAMTLTGQVMTMEFTDGWNLDLRRGQDSAKVCLYIACIFLTTLLTMHV